MDLYGNNSQFKSSYLKYIIISILIHILLFLFYQFYLKDALLFNQGASDLDNTNSFNNAIAVSIAKPSSSNTKNPNKTSQSKLEKVAQSDLPASHTYIPESSKIKKSNEELAKDEKNMDDKASTDISNSKVDYYHKSITYQELLSAGGAGNNATPNYPLIAKINKWQGEVIVIIKLNEQGYVDEALIKKSSGFEVLDSSAIKSIKNWHINNKYGQKLIIEIPVIFKLIK